MASREIEKKRRREKRNLTRKRPGLSVLPTILIVCEGKNTEPSNVLNGYIVNSITFLQLKKNHLQQYIY
nr:hypothetical protein [uncultured Sphaerochaeta sp.]